MIEAQDVKIEFPDGNNSDDKGSDKENGWFSIDTEPYEAQSVNITLMPKKLRMYAK